MIINSALGDYGIYKIFYSLEEIIILLSEIAAKLNDSKISVVGNPERDIKRISSPEDSDKDSLCVIWDSKAVENLSPDIPIAAKKDLFSPTRSGLSCKDPRALLPKLLALFEPVHEKLTGIDSRAYVDSSAKIAGDSYIAPFAFIGENCVIESGSIIEPHAVLLKNVRVGQNCLIHSGAVIGCDGFGFVRDNDSIVKIPQTGGVIIGDNVEIGACTTIDRAAMNDTVIGSGTKIDNQVQIGHNVKIGKNCIICSMSGIAGSSIIDDNVTISVQAGITDHVHIGERVIIAGRSGVTNDIMPGSIVSGFPARNHNEAKRALVLAADLPALYKRVRMLEKKLQKNDA